MENLELHIINRLKTLLIKHDMNLDMGSDDRLLFKSTDLVLYDNRESDTGVYFWTNINDMLFSKDNIFYVLYKYFNFPKYICQCSSTSLEELAIKNGYSGNLIFKKILIIFDQLLKYEKFRKTNFK